MAVLVAILLALGVPFAQLATVNDRVTCCCPSPDHCKCPTHKKADSQQTTMGVCHKQAPEMVRAQLAAFVAPALIEIVVPAQKALRVDHVLPSPHAPPPPVRPDGPS